MTSPQEQALVASKDKLVASYLAAHNALGEFIRVLNTADVKVASKHLIADTSALAIFGGPHLVTAHSNGKKRGAPSSDDDDSDDGDKKKRGKKKVKKEKDPNAPKRPPSAFILFQNAVRAEMRAQNPDIQHSELAKQIGDRWRALTEEEKQPWSQAGRSAMNEWNVKRKAYDEENPEKGHAGSPTLKAVDEVLPNGEKQKKKRGRPSNAELAAREPVSTEGKTKKDKNEIINAGTMKKSTETHPAQSSSDEGSSVEEAEAEAEVEDDEEEEAEAEEEEDEIMEQAVSNSKTEPLTKMTTFRIHKKHHHNKAVSEPVSDVSSESDEVAVPASKSVAQPSSKKSHTAVSPVTTTTAVAAAAVPTKKVKAAKEGKEKKVKKSQVSAAL